MTDESVLLMEVSVTQGCPYREVPLCTMHVDRGIMLSVLTSCTADGSYINKHFSFQVLWAFYLQTDIEITYLLYNNVC